jgi:hypothetical protein
MDNAKKSGSLPCTLYIPHLERIVKIIKSPYEVVYNKVTGKVTKLTKYWKNQIYKV